MENIHLFVKKEIDGSRELFYSWIFEAVHYPYRCCLRANGVLDSLDGTPSQFLFFLKKCWSLMSGELELFCVIRSEQN